MNQVPKRIELPMYGLSMYGSALVFVKRQEKTSI